MEDNFKTDFQAGEYHCLCCDKKFPMTYIVSAKLFDNYNHVGRKSFPGIAWTNFLRHLKKCEQKQQNKLKQMKIKTAEKFAEDYLDDKKINTENVEYIHVLDMMESFAKERAVEFAEWFATVSHLDRTSNTWEKVYDEFINS